MATSIKRVVGEPQHVLVTSTTTTRSSDDIVYVGESFVMYLEDAAAATTVAGVVGGVEIEHAKTTAADAAAGERLFYDTASSKVTSVSTGNQRIGFAAVASTTGATTTRFRMMQA